MSQYRVRVIRNLHDGRVENEYRITAANWDEAIGLSLAQDRSKTPSEDDIKWREVEWMELLASQKRLKGGALSRAISTMIAFFASRP